MKRKDITGQRFGKLVVIKLDKQPDGLKRKYAYWLCQCDCGNQKVCGATNLLSGNCNSCGCILKEYQKTTPKRYKKEKGEAAFNKYYSDYRTKANKKGIIFDLTKDDFKYLIFNHCKYCGIEPSKQYPCNDKHFNGSILVNGIDRINSNEGYIIDNCVSCCSMCNYAKRDNTITDFEIWLDRLVKFRINIKEN